MSSIIPGYKSANDIITQRKEIFLNCTLYLETAISIIYRICHEHFQSFGKIIIEIQIILGIHNTAK